MTNNIIGWNVGGVTGVFDTNTKIKRLTFSSTSTAADSFHTLIDQSTGAAYQVPASKKTTIVYITNFAPIDALGKLVYADDADGSTNAVNLYFPAVTTATTDSIFVSASAPASKYINMRRTSNAGTKAADVYAIEEAA